MDAAARERVFVVGVCAREYVYDVLVRACMSYVHFMCVGTRVCSAYLGNYNM